MTTSYPGGLDDFAEITTQKQNQAVGGRDHRQMHNDLGDAVEAIQAELGTDPAGSEATVKARIAAAESAISGKAASSHTHSQSDVTGLTTALADVDTRGPMPAVGEWLANGSFIGYNQKIGNVQGREIFSPSEVPHELFVDQINVYTLGPGAESTIQIGIYEPGLNGALLGAFEPKTYSAAQSLTGNAVEPFTVPKHHVIGVIKLDSNAGNIGLAGTCGPSFPSNNPVLAYADSRRDGLSELSPVGSSTTVPPLGVSYLVSFRRSA